MNHGKIKWENCARNFPCVLLTREYTRISRSGDCPPTRAVSLGGSRPSVLLRKRLYSRHGKLEGGQKVARKQTDERNVRAPPFADITTDIMSVHTKNKSPGDRPPYGLRPPVGMSTRVLKFQRRVDETFAMEKVEMKASTRFGRCSDFRDRTSSPGLDLLYR